MVLIHGAGSGPWVFDEWQGDFPWIQLVAPDLQEGLDVAKASMSDYSLAKHRDRGGPHV